MMPLAGVALGAPLADAIGKVADDVAIAILILLSVVALLREADQDHTFTQLPQPHLAAALLLR